jgi:hypothetical protein
LGRKTSLRLTLAAGIILLGAIPAFCWEKTYGDIGWDSGRSIQKTNDSGYIIAGVTSSFGAGSYDTYLFKIDAGGNCVWAKTYGGWNDDYGNCARQTTDGGYIMAGGSRSFSFIVFNGYIIKTDANGDCVWARTYGGDISTYFSSVLQIGDGGYVLSGHYNNYVLLMKVDSNGDCVWSRNFGGINANEGASMQNTSDGGYIIAGRTSLFSAAGDYDVYLIKTDANGDCVWTRTFGGNGDDQGQSVQQTIDGGYIISAYTTSYGAGGKDVYLIKTDASGNLTWYKTFGGSGDEEGYSVLQTSDGGYIVTGYTNSFGAGNDDVYLIRTDASGNQKWYKTFGGSGSDAGSSLLEMTGGGYIIVGQTDSLGAGSQDIYLITTDDNGNDPDLYTQTSTVTPTGTFTSTYTVSPTITMTGTSTLSSTITPTLTVTSTCSHTPTPVPELGIIVKGNFPNPFYENTNIVYWLSRPADIEIKIFTVSGEKVLDKRAIKGNSGYNSFFWDGENNSAHAAANGIYIYRITAVTNENEKKTITSKLSCIR